MNDVSKGTLPLGVNRDFGKHIRVQIYQLTLPKSHPVPVTTNRRVMFVALPLGVNRKFDMPTSVTESHPFSANCRQCVVDV